MPLSRRYSPEWSPGDNCFIGMDFSFVLPPGVGIAVGAEDFLAQAGQAGADIIPTPRMEVWRNTNPPTPAPEDWIVDPRYSVFAATQPDWFWVKNADGTTTWQQVPGRPAYGGFGAPALALGTAIRGRAVYTQLAGGQSGVDYQIRWVITDMFGNRWSRVGLLLCAPTS